MTLLEMAVSLPGNTGTQSEYCFIISPSQIVHGFLQNQIWRASMSKSETAQGSDWSKSCKLQSLIVGNSPCNGVVIE